MLEALSVGDPAMDSLADWMMDHGPREARALLETAITEGLAAILACGTAAAVYQKVWKGARPGWIST